MAAQEEQEETKTPSVKETPVNPLVKNKFNPLPMVLVILLILILAGAVYFFYLDKISQEKAKTPPGQAEPIEAPTLTPERIEIVQKLEEYVVTIQNQQFSPSTLTIKANDQVKWENKDNEVYQIKGDNWGNIPLRPGKNFTQAFEKPGTYSYSCALHPELAGTIIVE